MGMSTSPRYSRTHLCQITTRALDDWNFFLDHLAPPIQSDALLHIGDPKKFVGVVWETPASATKSIR